METPNSYILTHEVVFYPERGLFGYKIYGRSVAEPFLILVSPGNYTSSEATLRAANQEIRALNSRMLARDTRLGLSVHQTTDGAA